MLRQTFVHASGIGAKTERKLWKAGITDWDSYLGYQHNESARLLGGPLRSAAVAKQLVESRQALDSGNALFFASRLPPSQTWRAVPDFAESVGFLDIETTGLSRYYDEVTVVGLYSSKGFKTYIRGLNFDDLAQDLAEIKVLVTFNGSLFDLPFLRAEMPGIKLPPIHIDLRFLLARSGATGPLKDIEARFGIRRPHRLKEINGRAAASLWFRALRSERGALLRLLEYNAADTINLASLLSKAFRLAQDKLPPSLRSNIRPTWKPDWAKVRSVIRETEAHAPLVVHKPKSGRGFVDLQRLCPSGARVVGIDLAGSEARRTGWALMSDGVVETRCLFTDEDIESNTLAAAPDIVSIDSPLASPSESHRIYRLSELELKRRGISVFWCHLPTMMGLTARGSNLARKLRANGINVIESFPGAAQDILRIPRKQTGREELRDALVAFGIRGDFEKVCPTHDELDAVTSALVGFFYLGGQFEGLGNDEEDRIIIPAREWVSSRL